MSLPNEKNSLTKFSILLLACLLYIIFAGVVMLVVRWDVYFSICVCNRLYSPAGVSDSALEYTLAATSIYDCASWFG